MKFSVKELCTPAFIYFCLAVVGIVIDFAKTYRIMYNAVMLLFTIGWSMFLNYLCNKGYSSLSWIVLLLPLIVNFFVLAKLVSTQKQNTSQNKQQNQQNQQMSNGSTM